MYAVRVFNDVSDCSRYYTQYFFTEKEQLSFLNYVTNVLKFNAKIIKEN